MLLNKISNRLLFFLLPTIGCRGQSSNQTVTNDKDSLITNCYITKPIKTDSKADTLRDFNFSNESLAVFLDNALSARKPIIYDSTMDYVTNFDYQKIILVNFSCLGKLSKPDSCGLINIYFNSGFATWVKMKSAVQFLHSYKKNIYNFGNATVYEYRFNNVAEIEPHFMYIILQEQTEDEKRFGKNYQGFVLCCDGLDWKDYSDKGFSIPLFTQMVRRAKEFYIPLFFEGDRFIPIGHFKSRNWQE
jgi:hypothetical protein